MKKYRILNLYACLGGNRYKWDEVADNLEIVAVELDQELAKMYKERFPKDTVIVEDAHKYLLEHYKNFDFIWTSPPCPTHSKARGWNTKVDTKYPDMKLYEEIIMLETVSKGENPRFKGKYVVENVIPYYEPLIPSQKRNRHLYWANFRLPTVLSSRKQAKISSGINEVKKLCKFHEYDFYKYKGKQPINKIARNLVDYEAGRTILETVLEIQRKEDVKQVSLFN
jgi:DNA (cytosine-5)-methyltransferase 1